MSDTMRWRYGDTAPVVMAVDSATAIEVGDLLYLDTDDAKPAGAQADQETAAANQELFHDKFLGVAMQRSRAGDTDPIRVATRGVFEFDCAAAAIELGDFIGVSEEAGGEALENQKVIEVGAPNLAIGRAAKTAGAATVVLVEIVGTVTHGGPQAAA